MKNVWGNESAKPSWWPENLKFVSPTQKKLVQQGIYQEQCILLYIIIKSIKKQPQYHITLIFILSL